MAGARRGAMLTGEAIGRRIDEAALARLVADLGPEHVADVCQLFLADAGALVPAVREAHRSGDAARVARSVHRLKSASGFVGLIGISTLCAEIEQLAREDRLDEVGGRIELLAAEIPHISGELARLVRPADAAPS